LSNLLPCPFPQEPFFPPNLCLVYTPPRPLAGQYEILSPPCFGHSNIRILNLFRIRVLSNAEGSCFVFRISSSRRSPRPSCPLGMRLIRSTAFAEIYTAATRQTPKNQESKKAVSDSFKKRPSHGRVYAVGRLRRSSLHKQTADEVHQDV
jgi:hypothetical protein